MTDGRRANVVLVSVEPPWPSHHGGRIRTAGVAELLQTEFGVTVVSPDNGAMSTGPVSLDVLNGSSPALGHLRLAMDAQPRLGNVWLKPIARSLVKYLADHPVDAVVWSHSYIASVGIPLWSGPHIVDFANVEGQRFRSLARHGTPGQRLNRRLEAFKASRWEPKVACDASLCVASNDRDLVWLRSHNANAVLLPNALTPISSHRSIDNGPVLFLASFDYEPNRLAARWLVNSVWPIVLDRLPTAELQLIGRGASANLEFASRVQGVTVFSDVPDTQPYYAAAAFTVNPVQLGGGTQLKTSESLRRGRLVVSNSYGFATVEERLKSFVAIGDNAADFADQILSWISNVQERHRLEERLSIEVAAPPAGASGNELIEKIKLLISGGATRG